MVYNKNNYERNKENYKKLSIKWQKENPQQFKLIKKRYRENNQDKIKAYRQRSDVKEKQRLRMKKIRLENPNLVKEQYQKHKTQHKKWMDKHRSKPDVKKANAKYNKQYAKDNPDVILRNIRNHLKRIANANNIKWYELVDQLRGWSKIIHNDSNQTCVLCGNPSTQAHYILHKSKYPQLAFNRNNGIALCDLCHKQVHGMMLVA